MYLQEILEVAIGLIFIWLALSFTTMSVQEWISNILNLRAKDLEKAITRMLNSNDLTRRFYEYPLIANLYIKPRKPGKKPRLPSYIPAKKFSAALFELVIQAGTDNCPVQRMANDIEKILASIKDPDHQKLAWEDWDAIMETARKVARLGLGIAGVDSLKYQIKAYGEKYPELKESLELLIPQVDKYYGQFAQEQREGAENEADNELAMRQFRLGMLALKHTNPGLGESVVAIIRQAEVFALRGAQAIAATRLNLESWFNDGMERLSGAYKRRAQLVAFIIGFLLALLLNVDSITVATRLWREPILRQAILAQAQGYAAGSAAIQPGASVNPLVDIPALETQLKGLNIPVGWTIASLNLGPANCSLLPVKAGQFWGLPLLDKHGRPVCHVIVNLPADLNGWLVKILGMLIAGLAAAQGAPFWFDILKKFINVRGTGAAPLEEKPVG